MKIIDQTEVHDQVNVTTVFSKPDKQIKSCFINA